MKKMKHKGFYLVEAIIALFLISAGLLVAVELLSKITYNSFTDRDNIAATMLAQEGVELVRNLRDNNFATGKGAFEVNFGMTPSDTCIMANAITSLQSLNCSPSGADFYKLFLNADKYYVHTVGGTPTKFQRRISIRYSDANGPLGANNTNYAIVTSLVTWKGDASSINIGNVSSDCTASKGCSYVQVNLTRWAK